jgi:PAS domain S-box-containing protein
MVLDKCIVQSESRIEKNKSHNSFIETRIARKDGTEFFAEATIQKIEVENKTFYQAILRNITDRISVTSQIIKLNNVLQLKGLCNRSLVKAKSENHLIQNICNIICEKGGYSFVWMGYVIKDEMKHILPHYHSGYGNGFLNSYNFTWSEETEGNTPEGIAIKSNKIFISPDNEAADYTSGWKLEMAKGKLVSTIALPLMNNMEVIGVLSISSNEKNRFNSPEVVDILEELSNDLSFGIMSIRERENKINAERLLRKSEERYRSFFEEDLTGDFTFTISGKILMCNKAFAKILGTKSINEVINHNLYDFFLEKDDLKNAIGTIKEKGRLENHEITLIGLTGKTIFAFENMIGIYDDNGNLAEITGYLFDITEIKKTHEQLILAKEKAEGANRLKSEFLSQISHEIRTPLNAILSFSQLIENDLAEEVDDDLKEGFDGLKRAGKRITRTIDSILNLSELHTGGYDYSPRLIDIHAEIIEDLYLEFFMVLKEKKLNFSVDLNTTETKVTADEYSTKQIFTNLIDNAIKFTHKGNINISMERNSSGKLCVTIADTGVGIAEEYLPKLFTPFSQEEQGYTRSFDGNGLGLALVKKYCEVNNIQITVQSKKGNGTTFTLLFLN